MTTTDKAVVNCDEMSHEVSLYDDVNSSRLITRTDETMLVENA